tara:strand:- start:1137 stop:1730 length:594 start_codon:yes stop_codon:yes gene_type:complete
MAYLPPDLNSIQTVSTDLTSLNLNNLPSASGLPRYHIVGYTPTEFATADSTAADQVFTLQSKPNVANTASLHIKLPGNLVPISIVVQPVNSSGVMTSTANGLLNIGTNSSPTTMSNTLLDQVGYNTTQLLTNENNRVAAFGSPSTVAIGGSGISTGGSTSTTITNSDDYITITLLNSIITKLTKGSLQVTVDFMVLP